MGRWDDDEKPGSSSGRRREHPGGAEDADPSTKRRREDGGEVADGAVDDTKPKARPDFKTSGALAKEANTVRGVALKYSEPAEGHVPSKRWRLYIFKQGDVAGTTRWLRRVWAGASSFLHFTIETLHIHRQSFFLFGRDRRVADIATDHHSCSSQHAVLQYRRIYLENEFGEKRAVVRPYIIDLGSTNGTLLNGDKIEPQRYYQLKETDVLQFGFSSREYVLLHEDSAKNQRGSS